MTKKQFEATLRMLPKPEPIEFIFEFRRNFTEREFTLGDYHFVHGKICQFIKVTPKAFNFVDIATNKCVLSKHLPCRKYWGKKRIPHNVRSFVVQTQRHNSMNITKALNKGIKIG